MNNKNTISLARLVIIVAAVFALFLLFVLLPFLMWEIIMDSTTDIWIQYILYIWYGVIFICAIPCFIALMVGWKITKHIKDHSIISNDCCKLVRQLYKLSVFDIITLTIFLIIVYIFKIVSPMLFISLIIIVGLGCIFALIFKVTADGLDEAIKLREESELTI